MAALTIVNPIEERVEPRRLLWGGPLAIAAAVAANTAVRAAELAVLDVPESFTPLVSPAYAIATVVGVLGAVIVFAIVATRARRPITAFLKIAWGALALSALPALGLLMGVAGMPPAAPAHVAALLLMHVTAFAVSVPLLITLTREP